MRVAEKGSINQSVNNLLSSFEAVTVNLDSRVSVVRKTSTNVHLTRAKTMVSAKT